jgi:prolyl-tRNA synthetase
MRRSQLLTAHASAREPEADLLTQAGYIRELSEGLYSLLPLGQRVLSRVSAVVREELSRGGAQEVSMPLLQPESLWQTPLGADGTRAEGFADQLFRARAAGDQRWVLAPTHEEVAALLAAACVRDLGDLPRTLFQIAPRFRDHSGSAGRGLFRTREFVMADAYSFHADGADLEVVYQRMSRAFSNVLELCGVQSERVAADSGTMGGDCSEEFIAPLPRASQIAALRCGACRYAASIECASFQRRRPPLLDALPAREVSVPDSIGLEAVAAELGLGVDKRLATIPFIAAGRVVLAVIPLNLELNVDKLRAALRRSGVPTQGLHLARVEELVALGASYEWVSLLRTPRSVWVVADESVRQGGGFFVPALRVSTLATNLHAGRDFRVDLFTDLALASEGDACPECGEALGALRGVEIAHVFKLGTSYATAFGAAIRDPGGSRPLQMGCYGLGVTRLISTVVEQRRDERGLVWPERIAPYLALIFAANAEPASRRAASALYDALGAAGVDVLFDDSQESPGEQQRYADLLGIPLQLVTAAGPNGEQVELRERASSRRERRPASEIAPLLLERAHGLRGASGCQER